MFHLFTELPKGLGRCNKNIVKFGYVVLCLSTVFQLLSTGIAQAYAGKYVEVTNASNELILTYEEDGLYSGVLFEGIGIYAIQANEEDVALKGLIRKSRSSDLQDVSFFATLSEGRLVFKTNLVTSDGEIDANSQAEIIYVKPDAVGVKTNIQTTLSTTAQAVATPEITSSESKVNTTNALVTFSVRTGTLTGDLIEPDQQYWGGAQLQLTNVGMAFEVPSAGTAIHTSPEQRLVIGHTSTLGNVAIHAVSTGNFEAFVNSHLNVSKEQVLETITEAIKTEDFYRASYKLTTGTRISYLEIAAQKAPLGNMVLLKAKSRMQEAEDISLVVDMLLESLVFAEVAEVSLKTSIVNSRVSSVDKTDEAIGFIDLCNSNEFRVESFEDAEDIQIGLWKPAASIFSSGIVLNSIDGDFHYVALEDDVATFDESVLLIEPSPYCQ